MSSYKVKASAGDTKWFINDRFGMFIHFGLYSLPARHEWIKHKECIPEKKYNKYFEHFNPDLFDAKEWARAAKNAGMKYAVLTAKHHEGFCLFDSAFTDYKITNTAFGRDLVKEYVNAFRAEGLKVGFYYSLLDWNHPDFPIDNMHPRRYDENADQLDKGRDMKKYAEYMRNQVTELLTNYGKIDILWFDFSYDSNIGDQNALKDWMQYGSVKCEKEWEADKMISLVRKLQPDIILNDRISQSDWYNQDIITPEQVAVTEWPEYPETKEKRTWELCQTFSGSWGYFRDENTWKSPKILIDMLIDTVSFGGNLIMNVGPTSRGYFDKRAEDALSEYGEWMKYNSRSIYGCTMAEPEFVSPDGTKFTQSFDGKRLYLHLQKYPYQSIEIKNLAEKIDYIQFLHDGSELLWRIGRENSAVIELPAVKPDVITPVIEIFLK